MTSFENPVTSGQVMTLRDVHFPAVARATPAGWIVEASSVDDLASLSVPFDPEYWRGLEIFDSSGRYFVAQRVFLTGDGKVDAELRESSDIVLDELQPQLACLAASRRRFDRRVRIYEARDLRGMIQAIFYD
jgi:hypothetical protein